MNAERRPSEPPIQHKVVIAIPVYNEQEHLDETLASILRQTYADYAVLMADNASTDESQSICEEAVRNDRRFHYVRHEQNLGAVGNIQFLLDQTDCEYFLLCGAHDLLEPDFLRVHIENLEAHPDCVLSYSDMTLIDESGDVIRPKELVDVYETVKARTPFRRACYMFTKRIRHKLAPLINHPIRKSALRGVGFYAVPSCDIMVLSMLLYRGHFRKVPGVHFKQRCFPNRDTRESYIERITARKGRQLAVRRKLKWLWTRELYRIMDKPFPCKIAPCLYVFLRVMSMYDPKSYTRMVTESPLYIRLFGSRRMRKHEKRRTKPG